MDKINNYVISICFAIIFCVVAEAFTPSEKYSKIIKMASGLFIIYTLMSPIKSILNPEVYKIPVFDYSNDNQGVYKMYEQKTIEVLNDSVYRNYEQNLETDIEEFIKEDINVSINKDDFSVTISGVTSYNREKISKFVEDNYKIKPIFTE